MSITENISKKYSTKIGLCENDKINYEKLNIIYNSQLTYDKYYSNINNCKCRIEKVENFLNEVPIWRVLRPRRCI